MEPISSRPADEETPLLPPLRLRRLTSDPTSGSPRSSTEKPYVAPQADAIWIESASEGRRDRPERECQSSGCATCLALLMSIAAAAILIITSALVLEEGRRCSETGDCSAWNTPTPRPDYRGPLHHIMAQRFAFISATPPTFLQNLGEPPPDSHDLQPMMHPSISLLMQHQAQSHDLLNMPNGELQAGTVHPSLAWETEPTHL